MKYIKKYEGLIDDGIYWRINGKSIDYIKISLFKIGLSKEDSIFNSIMNKEANYLVENNKYLYIGLGYDKSNNTKNWWYSYNLYQFKNQYNYKGQIKVSDYEIDAEKYNL